MTRNTSHAVMAQRHEPPDGLDCFPTPPWATRALCEHLDHWGRIGPETAWDPACGEGHMARPLAEYCRSSSATRKGPKSMNGATDDNRLSREERELLASIRRWFRYRTPENLRHVVNAARDWIRSEHRREDDARGVANV